MKKIKFICIVIISLFVLILLANRIQFYISSHSAGSEEETAYTDEVNYLNKTVDAVVLLYGTDIQTRDGFEFEKLQSINKQEFDKYSNDYIYLIINDLDGKVSLDINTVTFLKEYADQNTNFNFFYIGEKQLELFVENVFPESGKRDGDMSFGYVLMEGVRLCYSGLWTTVENDFYKEDKNILINSILDDIVFVIKTNE